MGGGLINRGGSTPDIRNCVFTGNSAGDGGGMFNGTNSRPTVTHCLFNRNWATEPAINGLGGGMRNNGSNPTVINCTFSENTADIAGGAMSSSADSRPIATNCIFWRNRAPNGAQIVLADPLIVTYSCVEGGFPGTGNMGDNPLFANPENGDYRLMSQAGRWNPLTESWETDDVTSPCVDTGDSDLPIGLESIPNGGFVNMGAYGGTAEASRSYFGAPPCESIVAGDINGDCQVDRTDLEIMALHWTDDPSLLP